MAVLPARDAAIFALRHFEDLSYRQIASQMELSVDQVGVILHRTRKRLRKVLEPIVGFASRHERVPKNVRSGPGKDDRNV